MAGQETTVCVVEDRPRDLVAVKLLVASIGRCVPGAAVVLSYPPADDGFARWVSAVPFVELRTAGYARKGWDVKPYALLDLLSERSGEVWWIDSDIIVARDFRELTRDVTAATIVLTEEPLFTPAEDSGRDGGRRARAWGLPVARAFPRVLNTCVVRVTREHIPLVERWIELLESETYLDAPADWLQRPTFVQGDQDVLTALLTSQEFAHLPVRVLRAGGQIIPAVPPAGPSPRERWSMLRSGPATFVHGQGWAKPWFEDSSTGSSNVHARLERLHQEISPYTAAARPYRSAIEFELANDDWLSRRSRIGAISKRLGFGKPALTGLPLSLAYGTWRSYKTSRERLFTSLGRRRAA